METEKLKLLSIAKDDLVWLKEGKEIIFNSELYDVKEILETGDSLLLFVFKDIDEKKLLAIKKRIDYTTAEQSLVVIEDAERLDWTSFQIFPDNDVLMVKNSKPKTVHYKSNLEQGANTDCFPPPRYI